MTWRGRHIYLVGLPGAGKSSIGRELSGLLAKSGYEFFDLDEEIVQTTGKTITEIFSQEGEERFREIETEQLLILSQRNFEQHPCVIATGGGTPLRAVNRSIMRGSGIIVWIDVTIRQAAKNVVQSLLQGETRPLLRSTGTEELTEKLRVLLEERRYLYEQATMHFVTRSPRGDERSAAELAEELLKALEQMSRAIRLRPRFETFIAHSGMGDYPVAIGSGIAASELGASIRDMNARRAVVITDENVARIHGQKFSSKITQEHRSPIEIHQIVIAPGESSKDKGTLFEILDSFVKLELSRKSDVIITLGGGVVSDIGGLAASLYNRGLPLIHVPTTLIGQADAAIGGKTAIDYAGYKNYLGTFYAPRLVLIDPIFLKTLSKRDLNAGLAEIVKYALIGSPELWSVLAKSLRRLLRGVDSGIEIIIRDAVQQKLLYVNSDEFERKAGRRELLNFGHTFAHAFEASTDYSSLLHGEAVALGMRAAAWLSMELGMLDQDSWSQIEVVLGRLPIPVAPELSADQVLKAMRRDKKRQANSHRIILLEGIGKAVVRDNVDEKSIRSAIDFVLSVI
ncbi:MAG: 3-dehydroquinate synthase [Bacteroidota bacterium]|nr:3-dehydroquinate synthase [Bacteroidota bacterium]